MTSAHTLAPDAAASFVDVADEAAAFFGSAGAGATAFFGGAGAGAASETVVEAFFLDEGFVFEAAVGRTAVLVLATIFSDFGDGSASARTSEGWSWNKGRTSAVVTYLQEPGTSPEAWLSSPLAEVEAQAPTVQETA
jgi:hypothetical protein